MNMMFTKCTVLGLLVFAATTLSGCCGPMAGSCGTGACGQGVMPTRLAGRVANSVVNPCGDGCGEVYYGERINHPPVCDPCGDCGGCGSCGDCCRPLLARLRECWGLPYIGACECATPGCDGAVVGTSYSSSAGSGSHCASCAAGHTSHSMIQETHSVPSTSGTPTPAVRPQEAQPTAPVPQPDPHASHSSQRRVRPVSASRTVAR